MNDLYERQKKYMCGLRQNITKILTLEQQKKYCLLFAGKVLFETDDYETVIQKQKSFSGIQTVLYVPGRAENPNGPTFEDNQTNLTK